jgi:hypothetical protein
VDDQDSIKASSIYTSNSRSKKFSKNASCTPIDDFWVHDIAQTAIARNSIGQMQLDDNISFAGMSNIAMLYDDEGERTEKTAIGSEKMAKHKIKNDATMKSASFDEADVEYGLGSNQSGGPPTSECSSASAQPTKQEHDMCMSQIIDTSSIGDIVRDISASKNSVAKKGWDACSRYRKSSTEFKVAVFITCALFCALFIMLAALLASSIGSGDSRSGAADQREIPDIVEPTEQNTDSMEASVVPAPTLHPTTSSVQPPSPAIHTAKPLAATTILPTLHIDHTEMPFATTNSPSLSAASTEKPLAITIESPAVRPTSNPIIVGLGPCIDGEEVFQFNEEVKNCSWLAKSPVGQFILCQSGSSAYSICLATCGNCP